MAESVNLGRLSKGRGIIQINFKQETKKYFSNINMKNYTDIIAVLILFLNSPDCINTVRADQTSWVFKNQLV